MLLVFRFQLIKNVLEFLFQNLKSGIGNCIEIPHFVVNYELCACVYKTLQLFKVGHVCIVLQPTKISRVDLKEMKYDHTDLKQQFV